MRPPTRLAVLVGALVLAGALVVVGPTVTPEPDSPDVAGPGSEPTFVSPGPNGSVELWPHTSRTGSFDDVGLPINVVVRADAGTVRRLLTSRGTMTRTAAGDEWVETTPAAPRVEPIGIAWRPGHGADRYVHLRDDDGGEWVAQRYQLRDGDYFGTQYHLRAYAAADDDASWTAVQVHHEHWDWFRLRHTVDTVSGAQRHLELDLVDRGLGDHLSRERYANGGAVDSDGWVTVVDLRSTPAARTAAGSPAGSGHLPVAPATPPVDPPAWPAALGLAGLLLLAGTRGRDPPGGGARTHRDPGDRMRDPGDQAHALGARVRDRLGAVTRGGSRPVGTLGRRSRDRLVLFVATAALMPLVRFGGIALERLLPATSPYLVGAPFYLLLVLGYPAVALGLGRRLPSEDAFAAAVLGMGAGVMLDYAFLGVAALPYDAVVHRLVLLLGLGLLAAGGTRWATTAVERHRYSILGGLVWAAAVLKPLVGV